jgi:phage shock protein PspC (stress-responsive transcriptional regulator)
VVWLIVALLPPTIGLLAYLIAWIVMPEEPEPVSAPLAERAPNV